MRNIFVKDLLTCITRYLLGEEDFYHISITDFQCRNEEILILVKKEEKHFEKYVISDLTSEDKFAELYDKLATTYSGRIQLITRHSFMEGYFADLIIEDKVMISFKYRTVAGQNWLSKLWQNN